MNNSKLVNVLRTFSGTELKEFEKFVSSPYFNKGRNFIPFLNILKKFHPKFEDAGLTPEFIYSKLYPNKTFNRQIIWNMTSGLFNLTEDFLLITALKKNRFSRNNLISGEYRSRKLERQFLKIIEEMEIQINKLGINPNYFIFKKQLESARKEYHYLEEKQIRTAEHSIKEGEYAAVYFLWTMVGVINDLKVHSYMFNTRHDINIPLEFINNLQLERIIDYCKLKNYSYSWFLEMCYCQIMMTLKDDGSGFFFRLKELFELNYKKFTDEEKLNWITCLINYCGYRSDDESRKILFDIHNFELKEGLAYIGKYLSKTHYLQILKNAIAINETEWVKKFIEEYSLKLKPSFQYSMKLLGLAYYYFKTKDYEKVIENLHKARFADAKDKLGVKLIYVRVYYELNETELLFTHIDSTLHFINDNISVIPDEIASNYRNFLKLLKKLINAKEKEDQYAVESIRKEVFRNKDLLLGDWLIEKIDELKEK